MAASEFMCSGYQAVMCFLLVELASYRTVGGVHMHVHRSMTCLHTHLLMVGEALGSLPLHRLVRSKLFIDVCPAFVSHSQNSRENSYLHHPTAT